jgi:endonuclease YncB( thermonuclease family)
MFRVPAALARWSSLLLAPAILLVASCERRAEPAAMPRPTTPELLGDRVRVLSGDVLVVDGQHIRLAGVAAPQPIPDARCWAEALAAKHATAQLREMVRQATEISVAPSAQRDAYNRTVTRVTLDRLDIGQSLADAGLAAVSPDQRFSWCERISGNAAGAPDVRALMDFGR